MTYSALFAVPPGGGGGSPAAPPPAAPPPAPTCEVELFTRPVYASAGIGTHSFLEVWGSAAVENTLEGGPTNNNSFFNPGPLRSFDTINGVAFSDDFPADAGKLNIVPCSQADAAITDDKAFKTTSTYSLFGQLGPNSNSFLHWLIA
jgi:hypothetical protein